MATARKVWVQPFLVGAVHICFMYIGDALTHKLKSTQPSFFFSRLPGRNLHLLHWICCTNSVRRPRHRYHHRANSCHTRCKVFGRQRTCLGKEKSEINFFVACVFILEFLFFILWFHVGSTGGPMGVRVRACMCSCAHACGGAPSRLG